MAASSVTIVGNSLRLCAKLQSQAKCSVQEMTGQVLKPFVGRTPGGPPGPRPTPSSACPCRRGGWHRLHRDQASREGVRPGSPHQATRYLSS
jgi:hypothetical protein